MNKDNIAKIAANIRDAVNQIEVRGRDNALAVLFINDACNDILREIQMEDATNHAENGKQ